MANKQIVDEMFETFQQGAAAGFFVTCVTFLGGSVFCLKKTWWWMTNLLWFVWFFGCRDLTWAGIVRFFGRLLCGLLSRSHELKRIPSCGDHRADIGIDGNTGLILKIYNFYYLIFGLSNLSFFYAMLLEIPWFLRLVVIKSNLERLKRPCKDLGHPRPREKLSSNWTSNDLKSLFITPKRRDLFLKETSVMVTPWVTFIWRITTARAPLTGKRERSSSCRNCIGTIEHVIETNNQYFVNLR